MLFKVKPNKKNMKWNRNQSIILIKIRKTIFFSLCTLSFFIYPLLFVNYFVSPFLNMRKILFKKKRSIIELILKKNGKRMKKAKYIFVSSFYSCCELWLKMKKKAKYQQRWRQIIKYEDDGGTEKGEQEGVTYLHLHIINK